MSQDVFSWIEADGGVAAGASRQAFSSWDVTTYALRGEPVLGILRKGTEIHCVLAPSWRQRMLPRHTLREWASAMLRDTGGMLTTRILHGSTSAIAFVERLGFIRTWSDDTFQYFVTTSAPFGRKTP
jgi:hypothetical protein